VTRSGRRIAVVAVAAVLCSSCGSQSFTNAKGSEAQRIAGVWWLMFGLAAAVYVIVAGFIIVGALRGRGTEHGRPSRLTDDGLIWIGGIIVPTLILLLLAVVTVHASTHLRQPEKGELRIQVVGKQWWWQVRYPDAGFETANEIHVPVGRPVAIQLDSDNVIHSFWVPQLAGKVDTIPGQHNEIRFTVKEPGTYVGHCAEFCGLQHANMGFSVIAVPAPDFDRWLVAHSRPPLGPSSDIEEQGQLAFMSLPCAGCHTIRGTAAHGKRGPDLTDFGARATIGAMPLGNTRANLAGWIVNAQTLKQGSMMPPIAVPPDQLTALVAYLESLK
jgi:cytochrome c oxidase subunit 2